MGLAASAFECRGEVRKTKFSAPGGLAITPPRRIASPTVVDRDSICTADDLKSPGFQENPEMRSPGLPEHGNLQQHNSAESQRRLSSITNQNYYLNPPFPMNPLRVAEGHDATEEPPLYVQTPSPQSTTRDRVSHSPTSRRSKTFSPSDTCTPRNTANEDTTGTTVKSAQSFKFSANSVGNSVCATPANAGKRSSAIIKRSPQPFFKTHSQKFKSSTDTSGKVIREDTAPMEDKIEDHLQCMAPSPMAASPPLTERAHSLSASRLDAIVFPGNTNKKLLRSFNELLEELDEQ
mmetsp:Transcript_21505/g.43161  ORF Transcript_21505/g.43161 Transcript_21505/m.43161 type:complete len:292 (-) Transcript_21505:358-1233(-)